MKKTRLQDTPAAFYYNLQNARLKEHAFLEWNEYRKSVTDFLIQNCREGGTLAIFGAGRCNDIDLKRLAGHFSEITLVDRNKASMQAAIRQYQLSGRPGITISEKDFVGIADEDYIAYIASILEPSHAQGTGPFTDQTDGEDSPVFRQLNHMYKKARTHHAELGNKRYDCALVLNVHSQLNDTADWIRAQLTAMGILSPADAIGVMRRIAAETDAIIKKFNDAVFAAVREQAFIGYETGIAGRKEGIEGAIQAYQDLRRREKNGLICSDKQLSLSWPCNRAGGIVFSVQIEQLILLGGS